MKIIFLFAIILLNCSSGINRVDGNIAVVGKVIKIVDGDTFDILTNEYTKIRIRMNGIDCPEKKQDYYQVSKDALGTYIFDKQVSLITHGTDRYKRTLATVFLGIDNINLKMISNGYAWHYKKYSTDSEMALAEINARSRKLGLWEKPNSMPPWNFRKEHKK